MHFIKQGAEEQLALLLVPFYGIHKLSHELLVQHKALLLVCLVQVVLHGAERKLLVTRQGFQRPRVACHHSHKLIH